MRAGILSDVCARPTHSYERTLCKHVQIYLDQDLLMTIIIRGMVVACGYRPRTRVQIWLHLFGRAVDQIIKKSEKKKQSAI